MSVPHLAQATDHQQLEWLGGGIMHVMLDGSKTDGDLAMVRQDAARGAASPVHVHTSEVPAAGDVATCSAGPRAAYCEAEE